MYAVVGCNACSALWLLSDPEDAETARCRRCGKTHRTKKLRRFYQSDDRDAARQVRAAILAERGGQKDAFDDLESVAEMESLIDESGVGDREFLEASGLDADEVEAAGERSGRAAPSASSRSRDEVVEDALAELDRPTENEVVDYAVEHGVDADFARTYLDRLTRRGEASESGGRYRLL